LGRGKIPVVGFVGEGVVRGCGAVDIGGLIIAAVVGAIVGGLGAYLLGRRRRNG
jgi:membrane protein DedA with SNARE-associated domain